MTYSPISQAASYALRGFSPIPIMPGTKKPGLGKRGLMGWQNFCLQAATSGDIARWKLMDPRAGLGIACGFNGLVAIDVDDLDAFPAARRVFGHLRAPSKIGMKGATAFFRDPTGKIASRKFLKRAGPDGKRQTLVEVLSLGNSTTLPPTLHADTGRAYRWHNQPLSDLSVFDLPVIDEFMLQELKDLLAPLMEQDRVFEPVTAFKSNESISDRERRRYQGFAQKALEAEAALIAAQPKPGRNDQLFKAVCRLGKWAANGIIPDRLIVDRMIASCEQNGLIASNSKHDVLRTIRQGFARSANDGLPLLLDRPRIAA